MGPLQGYKILEIAGIGPGPYCGMLLADMGADVIMIERPGGNELSPARDIHRRGRRSVVLNLKKPEGRDALLKLCENADAVFEGFRPGVAERLGVGPKDCLARNPRIIYGRMTGWGQEGPYAQSAGHDINYIALSGALHAMGYRDRPPSPPLNLVGDFGGGSMFLALGLLCGLLEAAKSGQGQVIDAAMVDGAASLMSMFMTMRDHPHWGFQEDRECNLLDGGAHFYRCYETKDGKYMALGAIEPQFYKAFMDAAGINQHEFEPQFDRARWSEMGERLGTIFRTKTRDEWTALFEGSDACCAPVLSLSEAAEHPHNRARKTFQEIDGLTHPIAAPRFSRTRASIGDLPAKAGEHTEAVLREAGFLASEINALYECGVAE